MKFHLRGRIVIDGGHGNDDINVPIDEAFEVPDGPNVEEEAANIAKELVDSICGSRSVEFLHAELCIVKPIWKMEFVPFSPAQSAQAARPEVPAHFDVGFLTE